jgi:transposase InsO family protein
VIDLHNREVVGHAMAGHMRAGLVSEAVTLAAWRDLLDQDAILHPTDVYPSALKSGEPIHAYVLTAKEGF